MKFHATVIPSGNATAVEVPPSVRAALGGGARPAIVITINDHAWRSRLALMRGQCLVGISAANRAASGVAEGDLVEVDLQLDDQPNVVDEPEDLKLALDRDPRVRASFERLPPGLRRKHVADIDGAKSAEVRGRRIAKLIQTLEA